MFGQPSVQRVIVRLVVTEDHGQTRQLLIAQPKFVIAGLRRADVRVALFGADPTAVRTMPVSLQSNGFWS